MIVLCFEPLTYPTYLDKRHLGSLDISPPLSVDLLPSLPPDSMRKPRGTSAASSLEGCDEYMDPPRVDKDTQTGGKECVVASPSLLPLYKILPTEIMDKKT